jgi:hypothetical protein
MNKPNNTKIKPLSKEELFDLEFISIAKQFTGKVIRVIEKDALMKKLGLDDIEEDSDNDKIDLE